MFRKLAEPPRKDNIPWGVHISSFIDEELHDLIAASRTCNVQGEDTIKDGVDRLTVIERVLHQPQITCSCRRVQTKLGDYKSGHDDCSWNEKVIFK